MPVKDDKNRNGQRAGQKAEWTKFHKALAHLSDGHNAAETWAELKRKKARNLQTKFMAAWLVDKKWDFVTTFKAEMMHERDVETTEYDWLTKKQMFGKFGRRAKVVMKKKKESGQTKLDEDDGEMRWRVKTKETSAKEVAHDKATGYSLKAKADKSAPSANAPPAPTNTLPPTKKPRLAIEDRTHDDAYEPADETQLVNDDDGASSEEESEAVKKKPAAKATKEKEEGEDEEASREEEPVEKQRAAKVLKEEEEDEDDDDDEANEAEDDDMGEEDEEGGEEAEPIKKKPVAKVEKGTKRKHDHVQDEEATDDSDTGMEDACRHCVDLIAIFQGHTARSEPASSTSDLDTSPPWWGLHDQKAFRYRGGQPVSADSYTKDEHGMLVAHFGPVKEQMPVLYDDVNCNDKRDPKRMRRSNELLKSFVEQGYPKKRQAPTKRHWRSRCPTNARSTLVNCAWRQVHWSKSRTLTRQFSRISCRSSTSAWRRLSSGVAR